ncbi:MAG: cupin domain-containing protein [Ignavibacteriae bacterium]|nr:cupin domain-containing protein [Ignavibacteriota bacterium]
MHLSNIYKNIPPRAPDEFIETLLTHAAGKVERIVSFGHVSPENFWYDQETDEWVILLSGRARLQFEGESELVMMETGDYVFIPAHTKHRVEWTDPGAESIWLGVHFKQTAA